MIPVNYFFKRVSIKNIIYQSAGFFFFTSIIFSQWSSDLSTPLSIGSGIQAQAASTSSGGLYITWLSDGDYHVYLQYLNHLGEPQLGNGGLVVSNNQNSSWIAVYHLNLGVDHDGNAIITTVDQRTGSVWEVYAYKVGPDGTMHWGDSGIGLTSSSVSNMSPRLAVTENNSVIVTGTHNDNTVLFHHISSSGTLLWGEGILISDADATLISPYPVISSDNNIIIQWIRQTGPFWAANSELYLQKYDYDGNPIWGNPVVAAGPVVFPMGNWLQESIPDQNGGSISAWTEMSGNVQSAVAQHTDVDGNQTWATGVELSDNSSHFRISPRMALAESNQDLIGAWNESNSGQSQRGIYAQRIDSNGNRLWGSNGIAVVELNGNYDYLDLSVEALGDDIVTVYIEQAVSMNGDIYSTMLDPSGNAFWIGGRVAITNSNNPKSDMTTVEGPNCVYIVWSENGSVFTHCLRSDGSLGPPDLTPPPLISDQQIMEDEELAIDLSYIGESVSYSAESDTTAVSVIINNQTLLLTPQPEWHGISNITVYMTDVNNISDTTSFLLTVTSVNDPPTIEPVDDILISEDSTAVVFLNAVDIDTDDLMYNFYPTQPVFNFNHSGDSLYITPSMNWNGQVNLSIFVSDGENSDNISLTITVVPVNDPPIIDPIDDITLDEDESIDIILNSEDVDGDDLIYSFHLDNYDLALGIEGETLSITATTDFNGDIPVTIFVSDTALMDSTTFTVTVNAVNDPPSEFGLIYPTILDTIQISTATDETIPFTWESSNDVDSDVSYKLTVTMDYSGTIYSQDYLNIIDSSTSISVYDYAAYMTDYNLTYWTADYIVVASDGEYEIISSDSGNFVFENTTLSVKQKLIPIAFALHQNYPNPFNPITSLHYDLPEDGLVNITIYDMMGRVVKTLVNGSQTAGFKSIQWSATNDRNDPVSAGLYLYSIQAGEFRQTKKMVLLK